MEICLCWYQKGTNNKSIYDLINHLMVDIVTIIALACIIYIAYLNAYELQSGMKKSSTTLLMDPRVLHYTYDRG